jgi:UDP-N-acetylglucosamine transferase subunit ALG13
VSGGTVVVSAGSYHLPFQRLVDWMAPWVAEHPEVHVVMQHGPSRPLQGAENHDVLPYGELLELCRSADAIVLQGGAGGVMDMRAIGRVPVVVPRVPVDDEVVDEHQLIFTERAERLGTVHRAITREQLWSCLDGMLDGSITTSAPRSEPTPGVVAAASVLGTLPERLPLRMRVARLGRSARGILFGRRAR